MATATTAATLKAYAYLGTTGDVTNCDCCGKTELAYTIVLKNLTTNETEYFGRTCGARALKWAVKDLDKSVRATWAEAKRQEEARKAALYTAYVTHPLYVQAEQENTAFWQQTPRPSYEDYMQERTARGWMAMRKQAAQEVGYSGSL